MDCCCRECMGLAEFMLNVTGKDYGLARASGHAPFLVESDPCDGSMTCACKRCEAERRARIVRPVRPAPQPWESAA